MKYKKILITLTAIFLTSAIFAQDKIAVLVNNKMLGQTIVPESPVMLTVSKSKYKNLSKLTLKYTPQNQSLYKRSIEITDGAENSIYTLDEAKGGLYNINIASIKTKILAQKVIKVYLMENPLNDRMSIPSRRKLLIELHLK